MYKFRSMTDGADQVRDQLAADNEASGPLFKMQDDPRVTRVGAWMRKFSVDEFPQLLNVMRGEMSLVGPRPPLPGETGRVLLSPLASHGGTAGHDRPVAGLRALAAHLR